jgi:hypothetical protein
LLKEIEFTVAVCPFIVLSNYPVSKSQILMEASSEALAISVYSGWISTLVTRALWPVRLYLAYPLGNNWLISELDKFFLYLDEEFNSSSIYSIFYSNSIT